jgi:hypothetical protein
MMKIEYRWKELTGDGHLIEPKYSQHAFRVFHDRGFESEEEAVAAYMKVITDMEWDAPEELVLLKVYVRDFA